MKSTLLQNKKLKAYSALACSVVAIGNAANAQIVYTDITPDYTGTSAATSIYQLNLNNDALTDFLIGTAQSSGGARVAANAVTTGRIGGSSSCLALNANAPINNTAITSWSSSATLASWGTTGVYGNWGNVTNKYLPLKIVIAGQDRFGWARLDVSGSASSASFTIKDYAYDSTATSINAGQQIAGFSNQNLLFNTITIRTGNKTLHLDIKNNEALIGTVKVFNLLGEELKSSSIQNNEVVIGMDDCTTGIYLANITANGSTVTKKFLIK